MQRATLNIGANKGRPRLWLEGARLTAAGFKRGQSITVLTGPGSLVIRVDAKFGARTVSGKAEKPIIDILGRTIEQAGLKAGDKVDVVFSNELVMATKVAGGSNG